MVGLSGYLPRGQQIQEGREKFEKGGGMRVFLAHGGRDLLVPVSLVFFLKMCLGWGRG